MLNWLAALFFLLIFFLLIYFLLEGQRRSNRRRKVVRADFGGRNLLLCNGYTTSCGSPSGQHPCCNRGLLTLYHFLRKQLGVPLALAGETLQDVSTTGGLSTTHHTFHAVLPKKYAVNLRDQAPTWKRQGYVLTQNGENFTLTFAAEPDRDPLALRIKLTPETLPTYPVQVYGEVVDLPLDTAWLGASKDPLVCLRRTTRTISADWSPIRHCYIINDRRRWDRLHTVIAQLEHLGLAGSPINAVMGTDLDVDALIREKKLIQPSAYGRMSRGEIGCCFSHLKAWKKIAKQPDGIYAVLEDDVVFKKEFKELITRNRGFLEQRTRWDICTLGASPYNYRQLRNLEGDVYELGSFTGAWAYLLTPATAQCLCDRIFPITHPVDLVLTVFDSAKYPNPLNTYDDRFHKLLRMVLISNHTAKDKRWGIVGETSTNQGDSMSSSDLY